MALLRHFKLHKLTGLALCDSKMAYEIATGRSTCRKPDLKLMCAELKAAYADVAEDVIVAHIKREHNKADAHVRLCRNSCSLNDPDILFPNIVPQRGVIQQSVDPVTVESEMPSIDDANDFAQIRLRKARRRCPDHLTLAWAQLVKTFTKKVASASNMDERELAMTQLLILPNIFLPANLALRTIDRHLHLQTALWLI